ncbi:unnamed protein product [Ambrosiozyma monospora]|uniref:Unnamed protein product n=1 Tax=Ambrosiozyma monospora TaxID=43982 RepID=A0ACB5U382_AMBMO|nr:unnamed protein product [Ambrosiozyma monospora]
MMVMLVQSLSSCSNSSLNNDDTKFDRDRHTIPISKRLTEIQSQSLSTPTPSPSPTPTPIENSQPRPIPVTDDNEESSDPDDEDTAPESDMELERTQTQDTTMNDSIDRSSYQIPFPNLMLSQFESQPSQKSQVDSQVSLSHSLPFSSFQSQPQLRVSSQSHSQQHQKVNQIQSQPLPSSTSTRRDVNTGKKIYDSRLQQFIQQSYQYNYLKLTTTVNLDKHQ